MTGMLKSIKPFPAPAVNLGAYDVQRRVALEAQIAHQRMVGNRKALEAELGPQGYAKALALALALQQAQATSAALLAASDFTG